MLPDDADERTRQLAREHAISLYELAKAVAEPGAGRGATGPAAYTRPAGPEPGPLEPEPPASKPLDPKLVRDLLRILGREREE